MAKVRPQCRLLHPLHCLFMDKEVDELGDGLEELGIEIVCWFSLLRRVMPVL